MEAKTLRTPVPLSDTNQTIADPAEDIRGRTVCDNGGEKVGTVEELLIDGEESAVRMLRVEHGGIFGNYDYYGYAPYWAPRTGPAPRWAATLGRSGDIGGVAIRPRKDEG